MARYIYETGSVTNIRIFFTDPDADDAPVDPFTVTLEVLSPLGVLSSLDEDDLENPEIGTWYYPLELAEEGIYSYRWRGYNGPNKIVYVSGTVKSEVVWTA